MSNQIIIPGDYTPDKKICWNGIEHSYMIFNDNLVLSAFWGSTLIYELKENEIPQTTTGEVIGINGRFIRNYDGSQAGLNGSNNVNSNLLDNIAIYDMLGFETYHTGFGSATPIYKSGNCVSASVCIDARNWDLFASYSDYVSRVMGSVGYQNDNYYILLYTLDSSGNLKAIDNRTVYFKLDTYYISEGYNQYINQYAGSWGYPSNQNQLTFNTAEGDGNRYHHPVIDMIVPGINQKLFIFLSNTEGHMGYAWTSPQFAGNKSQHVEDSYLKDKNIISITTAQNNSIVNLVCVLPGVTASVQFIKTQTFTLTLDSNYPN